MADLYHALAARARRHILDALTQRDGQTLFELCVRLAARPELSLSRQAISQHLDVLEQSGLVRTCREGRYKYHHLDTTPLRAIVQRWPLHGEGDHSPMRIHVTSVHVDDQSKALTFYTDILGFVKKTDLPLGEARWLTVVSPDDPDGTELLLEPDSYPGLVALKRSMMSDGIPATSFAVDDVVAETARLHGLGVTFTQEPVHMGPVTTAVFDDTCGNLIQIAARAS